MLREYYAERRAYWKRKNAEPTHAQWAAENPDMANGMLIKRMEANIARQKSITGA